MNYAAVISLSLRSSGRLAHSFGQETLLGFVGRYDDFGCLDFVTQRVGDSGSTFTAPFSPSQ
jgi:hypothetical protein